MQTSRLAACGVLFISAATIVSPRIISDDRIALKAGVQCFGTTADSTLGDTEPLIVADPRRPGHLVTIWQTSGRIGSAVQWSASRDGGSTWTRPAIVPVNACAGGPVGAARASDPWAEFARDGRLYLSAIAWQADARGDDSVNALVVVASSDGGHRWQRPVVVARQAPGIAHDNLSVTADPTRPRSAYLATTRIHRPDSATYYGQLGFARTTDGGRTWSALRTLTPPRNQERIGAPRILIDPRSGRLYAIYHRRTREASVVAVKWSDDGGDTWGDEQAIANHVRGPRISDPANGTRFGIADDIVHGAISPRTGALVVVFADARHSAGRQFGISVAMTSDGTRWTQPMDVSHDTLRTAWLPQVAIAPTGEIGISYYVAAFPAPPDSAQGQLILRRFTSVDGISKGNDREVLDEFALRWPGDYHGLAWSKSTLVAAYGRRSEIVVARSNPASGTTGAEPTPMPQPRSCAGMSAYRWQTGFGVALYGGATAHCGSPATRDTSVWVRSAHGWQSFAPPNGPGPREDVLVAFEPETRALFLYGGRDGSTVFDDTWRLHEARWSLVSRGGGPGPVEHAAVAYDERRRVHVLFGGGTRLNPTAPSNATWEWDGTRWRNAAVTRQPPARVGHSMTWSASRGAVLLYGGFSPTGSFRDLWSWDGVVWTRLDSAGPSDTEGPAIFDTRAGLILIGAKPGSPPGSALAVWRFQTSGWQAWVDAGPPDRIGRSMALDASRERVVAFGGTLEGMAQPSTEVWELDVSSSAPQWRRLAR